jgi:hypothetical protein
MFEMQRRPPIEKAVIVAGEMTTTTPPMLPRIISFTGLFCLAGG